MANEIQLTTRLYAEKGGAYLPAVTRAVTLDMAGADMASVTQVIGTSDEPIAIPGDVTGDMHLEIFSLEPKGGNFVLLSNDDGGDFAAGTFAKLVGGASMFLMVPSGTTIHAKADTSAVSIQFRVCEA